MKPSFSIVVPVYNVALFLQRSLDSILASADNYLGKVEVICIDDGSVDGGGLFLDEYALTDPRIKVIHQANGGVGAARQRGLEELSCDWMLSVDPDDIIDVAYISSFAKAIEGSPDIDMVWCDYFVGAPKTERRVDCKCSNEALSLLRTLIWPGTLWGVLYTRAFRVSFVRKYNLGFQSGRQMVMEDLLFLADFLLKQPRIKWFDSCCYHYVKNDNSLTNSRWTDEKFLRQASVLRNLWGKIGIPEIKHCVLLRIKLFLSGTYLQYSISDAAFLSVFPEIHDIKGVDVAPWHRWFYWLARHGLRSKVLRLLALIRFFRRWVHK